MAVKIAGDPGFLEFSQLTSRLRQGLTWSLFRKLGILLGLVTPFASPTLFADSFYVDVAASGQYCFTPTFTSSAQSVSNVTCTGPGDSNITGSAKAGAAYLGAAIKGTSFNFLSSADAAFDMTLSQNQLASITRGDQINFLWSMDGIYSVASDGYSRITFDVLGKVDGQVVLTGSNNNITGIGPSGAPLFGFYSNILGTDAIQASATGTYDVFMQFGNNILGGADSDFINTIQLAEIMVTDPTTGKSVDGISFSDTAGDVFPANRLLIDAAVPEPTSASFLMLSLVVLVVSRRFVAFRRT